MVEQYQIHTTLSYMSWLRYEKLIRSEKITFWGVLKISSEVVN